MESKKVLMVLTSHSKLGKTEKSTGYWEEEFAAPYYVFRDAGMEVMLCSVAGGEPPVDPASLGEGFQTKATKRLHDDEEAQRALKGTQRLKEVKGERFDAVFYPGGHGPMWDLAENPDSLRLIEGFAAKGKPIGAVCHGPAVLVFAKGADGEPLVKGREVAGFSNTEEAAVGATDIVPFLLEDELKKAGGKYKRAEDWHSCVAHDGFLFTGQNPASSEGVASSMVAHIKKQVPS